MDDDGATVRSRPAGYAGRVISVVGNLARCAGCWLEVGRGNAF